MIETCQQQCTEMVRSKWLTTSRNRTHTAGKLSVSLPIIEGTHTCTARSNGELNFAARSCRCSFVGLASTDPTFIHLCVGELKGTQETVELRVLPLQLHSENTEGRNRLPLLAGESPCEVYSQVTRPVETC